MTLSPFVFGIVAAFAAEFVLCFVTIMFAGFVNAIKQGCKNAKNEE